MIEESTKEYFMTGRWSEFGLQGMMRGARGSGLGLDIINPTVSPTVAAQSLDSEEVQLQTEIAELKNQLTSLELKYREEKALSEKMTADRTTLWQRLANARLTIVELNAMVKNMLTF